MKLPNFLKNFFNLFAFNKKEEIKAPNVKEPVVKTKPVFTKSPPKPATKSKGPFNKKKPVHVIKK